MSLRTLAVVALIATLPAVTAFAQSAPAPANQSGPSVSPTSPSPTDPAAAGQSGNTKGVPERGTTKMAPGTTGSGITTAPGSMNRDNTSVPGQGVNKDDTAPKR
jgi:hypothetical protein